MDIKLINIGFGNIVAANRIISIISPESAPIKRIIQEARDNGMLIDATYGRRTRAVVVADSGHIILSAVQPETVANRLVQSDDEEDEVYARGACDHGADEALVPRHVDEAEAHAPGKVRMGESQLDGDASALLLVEAVAVDARKGLDERCLAVVYVPGGSHDEGHGVSCGGCGGPAVHGEDICPMGRPQGKTGARGAGSAPMRSVSPGLGGKARADLT